MTFHTLECQRCGRRMTVTDSAPQRLICPNCLSTIDNPHGLAPGQAPAGPRPVIPLQQQVSSDSKLAGGASIAVTIVAVIGLVAIVLTYGLSSMSILLIAMVLLAAGGAWALSGFPLSGGIKPKAATRTGGDAAHPPGTRAVVQMPESLDYRGPMRYRQQPAGEPTNYWAAVAGFFLAIGVCAGGFFLLIMGLSMNASTKGAKALPLVLVVIAISLVVFAGWYFGRRPGWRGFMPGVAIGLGLGLMALGPCGFCYFIGVVAS